MITFVKERAGRGGTVGEDSTRIYVFESSTGTDSEYEVYRNRSCPKIGSRHPNSRFNLFYLKRGDLKIKSIAGGYYWSVEAKYTQLKPGEPEPEEEQDFQGPETPEVDLPDFQPDVTLDFEDYPVPFERAKKADGTFYPVVNSALEKVNNAEVNIQSAVIRVTRNLHLTSLLWRDALNLGNTINSDTFDYQLGTAKLPIFQYESRIKIRFGSIQEYTDKRGKKQEYASLEVQFAINSDTWKVQLLDVGSVKLSTSGKSIAQRITDNDWGLAGGTTQDPIEDASNNKILGLLDGRGQLLAAGDPSSFNTYDGYIEAKHKDFYNRLTKRV